MSPLGLSLVTLPLLLLGQLAGAEPTVLRMAAIAPEGTAWAREVKAFARDVEAQSGGALRLKWYLGGIAGDELEAVERVRRGQLDGVGGAIFCQRLAPTLVAARQPGLFASRDEAIYVLGRLKGQLDEEFAKSGFVSLGTGVFGVDVLFSQKPVRSMADLQGKRYWAWSLDPVWQHMLPELGAQLVSSNLEGVGPAWAHGHIDGMFVMPLAALGYQWSTQTPYYSDLEASVLPGCLVVSQKAFDPLPTEQKQILQAAAAKFVFHFNAVTRELDAQLVDGLFEKQGVIKVPATSALRAEYAAATKAARGRLRDKLVPAALATAVDKLIDEYRTTQRTRDGGK
jgi:TRAP-type C4-dicarboxylate transport system substrate-binding protein